ncbi:MAG: MFS transporter [DPANN group archaeon]|nr:MFS transporter [DPANN group archaeon]
MDFGKIDKSLIFLGLVSGLYFLAHSSIGIFLPNYYLELGLSINQIILLNAVQFILLGSIPLLMLRFFPSIFERLITAGIGLKILFFALLMFTKNPILLGIVNGVALAMFWPAFNLMLFRFSNIKHRGLLVGALYVAVPSLASIAGPFLGGALIHFFKFNTTFIFGIISLAVAAVLSLFIKHQPVTDKLDIPKNKLLWIFGAIIVIYGFTEISWIAYPLFLHKLTGGFLNMGIVATILAAIIAVASLVAGKFSEVEHHRIGFAALNQILWTGWLFALAFIINVPQLIFASIVPGIAGAFAMMLFALFGDFFERRHHALLVVLYEIFLGVGRLGNLIPIKIYLDQATLNFSGYFITIGLVSVLSIVPYYFVYQMYRKKEIATDNDQI